MTTPETKRRGRPAGMGEEKLLKMQKIVDFVREYNKVNNIAPTMSEIAEALWDNPNGFGNVQPMVKALIREGFLEASRTPDGKISARSLKVSKTPPRRKFYP